jgi:hypothetical protein
LDHLVNLNYVSVQAIQGIASLLFIERFLSVLVTQLRLPLPAPVLMLGAIGGFMATNSPSSIEGNLIDPIFIETLATSANYFGIKYSPHCTS